ncbi:DUF3373 family protein [uncultured Helicobacter sp.]|uniref:DUF3373 family protein n=1 Tax=uncultured Helicobacter sp. TaxID=175537 RepID=UPI00374EF851
MKTKGILLASMLALSPIVAAEKSLQQQIDELSDRVDYNELQATLNKVKFGLDFNTSMNNFFVNNNGNSSTQANKWLMGLYLNMNADITKYAKFTGRLAMTKAFGDQSWMPMTSSIIPIDAGKGVGGGSAVYVERAYVDLFLGNYWALTVGRLPGTEGPGYNLRNGAARMSTYPALLANALGDGGVITFKPYTDAALRVGFAKVYQPLYSTENSGAGSIFSENSVSSQADMNLMFATFETPFLPKSAGKSLAMLSYAYVSNYSLPTAAIQAGVANQVGIATGISGLPNADSTNLGDVAYTNLHLENYNLLGSGFNWFASVTWAQAMNSHKVTPMASISSNDTIPSESLFDTASSYALHVGARYDFGSHFKLGYEYFHGSKNWYGFSRVSANDPLNIRNTRGDVHDVYAIFQLDQFQFFRLSYTHLKRNYQTPSSPSAPIATDITTQNLSLAYILRF